MVAVCAHLWQCGSPCLNLTFRVASCRYDTATPAVDPVHVSSIVVPGGYNMSTLNTTQVSIITRS